MWGLWRHKRERVGVAVAFADAERVIREYDERLRRTFGSQMRGTQSLKVTNYRSSPKEKQITWTALFLEKKSDL